MRRLPWHLALTPDARGATTALSISLGVAFAVASFVIPSGLTEGAIAADGPLARMDAVVFAPDLEPFALPRALDGLETMLALRTSAKDGFGEAYVLVAFIGGEAASIAPGIARPTGGFPATLDRVTLGGVELTLAAPIEDHHLSAGWLVVSPETLRQIDPSLRDVYSYAIVYDPPATLEDDVAAEGLAVSRAPAAAVFLASSAREVGRGLLLVVAFTAVLVGLLVYEFMRAEIHDKRREIGLWRAIGVRSKDVIVLLTARAALIGGAGAALGATAAAFGLAFLANALGRDVLVRALDPLGVAALMAVYVAATIAGAIVPAVQAGRRDVRDLMEGAS